MRKLYLATLNNKHHIAFIFAIGISLNLIFSGDSPNINIIRARGAETFSFLYTPVRFYNTMVVLDKENELLRVKNLQLSLELGNLQAAKAVHQSLLELLDFKEKSQLTLLPAKVVSKGISSTIISMNIDVGKRDGVRKNLPVLTPEGVIGKTILAGNQVSVVQLISDVNFRLSIRVMPTGATGILRWKENGICEIADVRKNIPIEIGNRVVTSGFSNIYPPNLPVGEVIGVKDQRGEFEQIVNVKISNELSSIFHVFVILDTTNVRL